LGADLPDPADPLRMVADDDVDLVLAAIGNSPIGRMVSAINVASPEIGRRPGPHARMERHSGTGRGERSDGSPTSALSWV
jgi:hypothetical protein